MANVVEEQRTLPALPTTVEDCDTVVDDDDDPCEAGSGRAVTTAAEPDAFVVDLAETTVIAVDDEAD